MVLGAGEPVTESDAGNHCQGSCIVAVEHAIPPRDVPVGSCGRPAFGIPVITGKDDHVEEISEEPAELVERWPRWISARRCWWRVSGCRTIRSQAGAVRRFAPSPPRPGRCWAWRTGLTAWG